MTVTFAQTELENLSDLLYSEAMGGLSREEFDILTAERHTLTLGDVVQISSGTIVKAQLSGGTTKGINISKVPQGLVAATQVLDMAAIPTANDTVVVGGKTYKFVAAPGSANDVDIAGSALLSLDNLMSAINDSGLADTMYDAATVKNANVHAIRISATRMQVIAIVPGAVGNAIACTETLSDAGDVWGGAILAGGKGVVPTKCVVLVRNCVVKKEVLNYGGGVVATVDTDLKVLGIDPRSVPATLAVQTT